MYQLQYVLSRLKKSPHRYFYWSLIGFFVVAMPLFMLAASLSRKAKLPEVFVTSTILEQIPLMRWRCLGYPYSRNYSPPGPTPYFYIVLDARKTLTNYFTRDISFWKANCIKDGILGYGVSQPLPGTVPLNLMMCHIGSGMRVSMFQTTKPSEILATKPTYFNYCASEYLTLDKYNYGTVEKNPVAYIYQTATSSTIPLYRKQTKSIFGGRFHLTTTNSAENGLNYSYTLDPNLAPAGLLGYVTKPLDYWKGIVPGKTTFTQVTQALGTAVSSSVSGTLTTYEHASDREVFNHSITINNSTKLVTSVFYVVGLNETNNLTNFTNRYGQPEKVMYSGFKDGVKADIWPSIGLELWVEDTTGKIYFIRTFLPTNLTGFLSLYNQGLFERSPYAY